MTHLLEHVKKNWLQALFILFAFALIIRPQPFVQSLHWVFGVGLLIYVIVSLIRRFALHREGIRIGDCVVKAVLAGVVIIATLLLSRNNVH